MSLVEEIPICEVPAEVSFQFMTRLVPPSVIDLEEVSEW